MILKLPYPLNSGTQMDTKTTNDMTIPSREIIRLSGNDTVCMGKLKEVDSKNFPKLVFIISMMKQVIISQRHKIDMLLKKAKTSDDKTRDERVIYWFITFLLVLVGLRIVWLLPSQDLVNFQANIISNQSEIITSQAETILLLQNELRQTREFFSNVLKLVFVCMGVGVSFGYYFLSGLKNKIRSQEKLIVEQIYQGLIREEKKTKNETKTVNSLLFLSGTAFFVFVSELYFISTLF
jgi:hypothetical protein